MDHQGYTSWDSNPFQRAPPGQNRSLAGASYPNHGNVFPHDLHGQVPRQNSLQRPEASYARTAMNYPRSQSQPQPSYQSERHHRDRSGIDPTPDANLDALRQAMAASITPPTSPPPPPLGQTSSPISKVFSFVKGLTPLKATLARKFPDARYSVIEKLNELGVKWEEPHGTGSMYCEYGVKGTVDYVAFAVHWVVNGAPEGRPALPGGYQWFTRVEIIKDKGSGARFREIGMKVLDAAKYEVRGPGLLDYSITTWGLY